MHIKEFNVKGFRLGAVTLSYELKTDHLPFSAEDKKTYLNLLESVDSSPKEVYENLQTLLTSYPDNPKLLSLYSYVCFQLKKYLKGNRAIKANYQKNPDNLFAKINYGNLLVRKNRKRAFKKLFKSHDLTKLYPEKASFHVSEYRGFMTMMGFYSILIGARKDAICYHHLAKIADPNHPSVVCLGKKLVLNRGG